MAFTTILRSRKRRTLTTSPARAENGSRSAPRREILHLKPAGAEPAVATPVDGAT